MKLKALIVCALSIFLFDTQAYAKQLTDDQIRQRLIQESINSYSGSCPCPYNITKSGSRCGKRSAYSKPGGYEPLCFPSDVSDAMVERYRNR